MYQYSISIFNINVSKHHKQVHACMHRYCQCLCVHDIECISQYCCQCLFTPTLLISSGDSKLKSMLKSANDYLNKSLAREDTNDLSTSLICCQQAVSKYHIPTRQQSYWYSKHVVYPCCYKPVRFHNGKFGFGIHVFIVLWPLCNSHMYIIQTVIFNHWSHMVCYQMSVYVHKMLTFADGCLMMMTPYLSFFNLIAAPNSVIHVWQPFQYLINRLCASF